MRLNFCKRKSTCISFIINLQECWKINLVIMFCVRVSNQFICPVFKWGTLEEWEFGLQRVINFPPSRKQSERTYLLKTLAGCPISKEKIERLLNITILQQNGNFTENDLFLIFSMLSGGSSGYTTLFNFLQQNWDQIKRKYDHFILHFFHHFLIV